MATFDMSATVACIFVAVEGEEITLMLDSVKERMQPPRADLARVLRQLADKLDEQAERAGG